MRRPETGDFFGAQGEIILFVKVILSEPRLYQIQKSLMVYWGKQIASFVFIQTTVPIFLVLFTQFSSNTLSTERVNLSTDGSDFARVTKERQLFSIRGSFASP